MDDVKKMPGAVMVVGAGIAGIQAALDLAGSGFRVYLVEEQTAIGGTMAQLDKTFPTNDCAMCIISPKLVECGRHLDIELLTSATVVGLKGTAGDFTATIRQKPRFIDLDKCTGCGECEKACPISITSDFDVSLVDRKAAYKLYAQASPNGYAIDKRGIPPCQAACPAGIHVQGYIALAREGKIREAYDLVRRHNPFVSVCGRVCHHPCETECRRGEYDQPIAIASIKRYIADQVEIFPDRYPEPRQSRLADSGKKVAVIGAGPAGLTCAYFLRQMGHAVTVFEKDAEPGGMMRWAIPAYRLPRERLAWEIDQILSEGVNLVVNSPLSSWQDIANLRQDGYSAVFIGIGAAVGQRLNIDGEDLTGVMSGLDFLYRVSNGSHTDCGQKVAVIGGGNTAIDCARVVRRLGASVTVIYRRTRSEMPAADSEIDAAMQEGVDLLFLANPVRIIGSDGRITGVEIARMKPGKADESGRRRPIPTGERIIEDFDTLIVAVSQGVDTDLFGDSGLELTRTQTIAVDPITFATSVPGVFAGGDAVSGPASVIEAVAAAHQAAISIDRYLNGEEVGAGRPETNPELAKEFPAEYIEPKQRVRMPELEPDVRLGGFAEVETGFTPEEALREAERCLECGACSGCLQCQVVCEAGAVIHEECERTREIRVGAIIVATGAEKFNPTDLHEWGFGRYPNVVTSIQFERILAASGPWAGHLQRPGDGKVPRKIAWIQCVGSRTEHAAMPWCSSVCCMAAIKEAMIAREHVSTVEPTIFFMDLRAFGKDFDKFCDRAVASGVRFIRSRVGKLKEIPETGNIEVSFVTEDGLNQREEFDMVVLSVGLKPHENNMELAATLGIRLDQHGFLGTRALIPVETSRPGVFVCGPATRPKDIPETVTQASGAVAGAVALLREVRGSEIIRKVYPPEMDVSGTRPRIGVFVCHCGINIGAVVNVPRVVEYALTLPNVVYAGENLFSCSQDTQRKIRDIIIGHRLNRVVIASCSPITHEALFQETLRESGLNPWLVEMANIRNHCSWVHRADREDATDKAGILVRMAVQKVGMLEPLESCLLPVTQKGLVIGGGVTGMTAALSLADQGFPTMLVERESELGGNLRLVHRSADGQDLDVFLSELVDSVTRHPMLQVVTGAEVTSITGYVGNFSSKIRVMGSDLPIDYSHGITLLAVGAMQDRPTEFGYGELQSVCTQLDLESELHSGSAGIARLKRIVMIQCVGSRNDRHPWCSRVCCTQAVKNAVRIRESNPGTEVIVLYRDIRTYGFYELLYQRARDLGVIFVRYESSQPPVVSSDPEHQSLIVTCPDPVSGFNLRIRADRVVLAAAMIPRPESAMLSRLLKIPLNEDGFFLEAHAKLRPVDFAAEGVFLAGLAHSPKGVEECVTQARAAAERAALILCKPEYLSEATVAQVNPEICAGCGICVSICPYDAPSLVWSNGRKIAFVNPALCKGCGSCAGVCPSGAMQQLGYREEQTLSVLQIALETW